MPRGTGGSPQRFMGGPRVGAFSMPDQSKERDMSSTTDKAKGYANEAAGKIKQGVGKVVGNDRLEAEGAAQEVKGNVQVGVGKVKDAAKDGAKAVDNALNK